MDGQQINRYANDQEKTPACHALFNPMEIRCTFDSPVLSM
jgi:hypothetical protein